MRTYSLLIIFLYFVFWNTGIVFFGTYTIIKEKYKPKLFAFLFSFGLGLFICLPLPILQIIYSTLRPTAIWYSSIGFVIFNLLCYPFAYFGYKNFLMKLKFKHLNNK
jgi:hypothetical protein